MFKSISILYLVCFGCYIIFTRDPDYFDGEKSPAVIQWMTDSASGRTVPKAVFNDGRKEHAIDARYFLRELTSGEKVEVIYELDRPDKGAVYMFWGYWLTWGELIATILIYIALFQVAVAVTKNPSAESLIEQLDFKDEKKRKYEE